MEGNSEVIYNEEFLKNLLEIKAEESINLEFKRGDALINTQNAKSEISKDVSSFANSDGGIIIYGIEERHHVAEEFFFVDGNTVKKEWIEQVINSNIHRKIENLKIIPIRIDDELQKTVFVIEIPASSQAPHQASDKKFYRRYNFQSVAMDEYEIRNLYFRPNNTLLKVLQPVGSAEEGGTNANRLTSLRCKIEFQIENVGDNIEMIYKTEIKIPRILNIHQSGSINEQLMKYLIKSESDYDIFIIPSSSPIFQNEMVTVAICLFRLDEQLIPQLANCSIYQKLYYSNGVINNEYKLLELVKFNNKNISTEIFDN